MMRSHAYRSVFALFLALMMIVPSLVACSSGSDNTPAGTTVATASAEPAETEPPDPADALSGDYKGAEFVILSREETAYEVFAEELTGEPVNDAVYERNKKVDEKFNVKVKVVPSPGAWSKRTEFMEIVSSVVLAGDSTYDMVSSHMGYMVNLAVDGYGYNLLDLPHIDFDAEWWSHQYFTDCAINGKVFCGVGDIVLSLYENMLCVFFNKSLVTDYKLEDPYQTVKEGKWTIDLVQQYAELCGKDLNGDGKMEEETDQFGFLTNCHSNRIMQVSLDMQIAKRDKAGKLVFNLGGNEKFQNAYDKLNKLENATDGCWLLRDDSDGGITVPVFTAERAVFFSTRIGYANQMREMKSDYGIIPFPKWDEKQENYRTGFCDNMSVVFVPKTISDADKSGNVMEALCIWGKTDITPVYYETTLKSKYFSDATSAEMLDLIRQSAVFDVIMVYNMPLSYPYSIISGWLKGKTDSIQSLIAEKQTSIEKNLETLYEKIDSNWK